MENGGGGGGGTGADEMVREESRKRVALYSTPVWIPPKGNSQQQQYGPAGGQRQLEREMSSSTKSMMAVSTLTIEKVFKTFLNPLATISLSTNLLSQQVSAVNRLPLEVIANNLDDVSSISARWASDKNASD